MHPELTLFSSDAQSAGFRLDRFEVFNWGAFDAQIYSLPLSGENALLTGANGAGKTTLVDALIALLNPTPERYFNQSAGFEDRKRTRRMEDYVRGVYGHSNNGREQLRGRPDQPATYSVLLGVFRNNDLKQVFTLAHLYWFKNDELQKRFYTAPTALRIEEHFLFKGEIRPFNSFLTKTFQAKAYDSFNEFALDFQQKLGMRQSERANNMAGRTKPLHLLAKTAGIKVLGNLDAFIRDNMLDEANMDDKFDQLKKEYADIAETQQTLDKATEQERMLMPLLDNNTRYLTTEMQLQRAQRVQSVITPWFAQEYVGLLEREIERINNQIARQNADLEVSNERLEQLREEDKNIGIQLANNDEGRRLQDLQSQKLQNETKLKEQQKRADQYAQIVRELDGKFIPEPDAAMFYLQKEQIQAEATTLLAQKDAQTAQRDELVGQKRDQERQVKELEHELKSLRQRRNNLPADLVALRERLAQGTGIPEADLPFVGELVQIRPDEREKWEKALEKLLTPFSLHLLVPPRHLRPVVQWVRSQNLGTLLRFTEADDQAGEPLLVDKSPRTAFNKLEVQPKSAFAHWLRAELNQRYPHTCTEDTAEYERLSRAVTPEGLYKNGKQHQKDDRNQKMNFVLGWDNTEKIRQLDITLREAQGHLQKMDERILVFKQKMTQLDAKLANLQRLGDITDFKQIDTKSTTDDIQDLITQIEALSQASSQLALLREREKKVKADIKTESNRRDELLKTAQQLKDQLRSRSTQLTFKRTDAANLTPDRQPDLKILAEYLEGLPPLELDTIESVERDKRAVLRGDIVRLEKEQSDLRFVLERLMQEFKQPKKAILDRFPSWPNDTDALGEPRLDNIGDYTSLLERIQNDQLPALRERYQIRASKDIGNAMQVFQRQLEDQLNDHKDNILNINRALRALPYTHDTYLQVVMEEGMRKGRIGEFYQLLRSWDYDRASFLAASEVEKLDIWRETVQKIGAIIRRLDENPDWRREVTDVRNWLHFKTQQLYRHNDTAVSGTLQDSTSGKSGGEQAKLTYTVLAAALTYQFNISTDSRNARSFRFIVVDEAFSKLDPENSAYLLDLLGNLHFQMLIITPNTGINTGEKRMSHLIFVKKESETPPRSAAYVYSVKELKKLTE
jgi:uncharacterized protein YPO0396